MVWADQKRVFLTAQHRYEQEPRKGGKALAGVRRSHLGFASQVRCGGAGRSLLRPLDHHSRRFITPANELGISLA
jgi:hypothetical protein